MLCAFFILQLFHFHLLHIVLYSTIALGRSCFHGFIDGSVFYPDETHIASYLSAILASYC